jgi:PKD domain/Fibronectin type III domain
VRYGGTHRRGQKVARGSALALLLVAGALTAFAAVPPSAESHSAARPTVTIASIQPNPGLAGFPVVFQANGQDADGDAITYVWTFGDGTSSLSTPFSFSSHRYESSGTYTVSVVASAGGEDSDPSKATVVVDGPLSSNDPPTPPGNVRVTAASETSVTLAWNASTDDDGIARYGVLGGSGPQTTTVTSYTVTGLSCDDTYVFDVYAQDTLGALSALVPVTAHTSACTGSSTTTTGSGSTGTGPGGTATTPTTTSPGGGGGSGPGGGSRGSSLVVSSVQTVVVGHGTRRRVVVTLNVSQKGRAGVRLLKGTRTITSKRFAIKKGANRLDLAVPRKTGAGLHTLQIRVSNANGEARMVRRKVRLPR